MEVHDWCINILLQFSSARLYDESIDVDAEEVESPTSNSIKDRDLDNFQDKQIDYDGYDKVCKLVAWQIATWYRAAHFFNVFYTKHLFLALLM